VPFDHGIAASPLSEGIVSGERDRARGEPGTNPVYKQGAEEVYGLEYKPAAGI